MGVLRVLLAASVILAHSQSIFGFSGMGGSAVPAFFIVSGFYMSLILSGKYSGMQRLWLFYSNRALRLYPMYGVLLLLFLFLAQLKFEAWPLSQIIAAAANPIALATNGSPPSLLAAVPNLTFFGSDIIRVFVFDTNTMQFGLWFRNITESASIQGLYQYLVIPPIWSLGVEVVFYSIVPLAAMFRLRSLVLVTVASFGLNCGIYIVLSDTLAWFHLLAPYNLVFFFFGMVAQRLNFCGSGIWRGVLASVPFALWAFWQLLPSNFVLNWAYWMLFSAGIPALFALTRRSAMDTKIGSYSYPMYLCHTLFTWPMMTLGPFAGVAASLLSAALSFVLLSLVDRPIEAWRQRRASFGRPPLGAAGGSAAVPQQAS